MSWFTLAEISERTGISEAAVRSRLRRQLNTMPAERRSTATKQEKRTGGGNISLYSKEFCAEVFGKSFEPTERSQPQPSAAERYKTELLQAKYNYLLQMAANQKQQVIALQKQQAEATERERFYIQTIERQQQQIAVFSVKLIEANQPTASQPPPVQWLFVAGFTVVLIALFFALFVAGYLF